MANHIPSSFINDLLTRVDIVDVISARMSLRKAGRDYVANCPFHDEKTPSFTVSQEKQFYYCFGCHATGSALRFLMEFDHMEFVEAVYDLAAEKGLEVPVDDLGTRSQKLELRNAHFEMLDAIVQYYVQQLKTHAHAKQAVDYLKNRGLSGSIAHDYRVGFAPPGWDNVCQHFIKNAETKKILLEIGMVIEKSGQNHTYDRFRNRIMFPIRDRRGRTIGFGGRAIKDEQPKYLNSPETALFQKGTELYGLFEAHKKSQNLQQLLVVEGYMDVLALAQHGISQCVATLGTAVTREHLLSLFRAVNSIVFCFDGDQAGRKAAWRSLELVLPMLKDGRLVHYMFLPEGEDPDSLIRSENVDAFNQRIANSIPLSTFLFESFKSKADLRSIDGYARLIELSKPLVSKIPYGIFRRMVIEKLSEVVHINSEKLTKMIDDGAGKQQPFQSKVRVTQSSSPFWPPSLVRLGIRFLLHNPSLAHKVTDKNLLAELELPGMTLFIELVDLILNKPDIHCGIILEQWHETEKGQLISKIVEKEVLISEDEIDREFEGLIAKLLQKRNENRRQQLLNKSNLDTSERNELQKLFIPTSTTKH